LLVTASIKKFPREYGHGRANYINGPRVAGARSLPAKLDQVISSRNAATAAGRRAPGPGLFLSNELRAASVKLRAERRAASYELQATSYELGVLSNKRLMWGQSSSAKHGVSRWSDSRPRIEEL